ncbi:MAG: 2-oxo-4-hydroxy-4-carboxy-5-ureidoimidazoline decarboxylase [Alphaproteobacteria bacterium]|nr:2-oxo-4-hydroxy-4-carboxy-5-ureidoimidazoline decarboxylase [Alphaproteobacteria bacterium]
MSAAARTVELAALNQSARAEFVAALDGIFENAPWVAEAVHGQRPFADLPRLMEAFAATIGSAGAKRQRALIEGHPDLAGKAARAGELTAASAAEQSSAGLDRLSPEEFDRFHRLNNSYRARFDFPFIVCVRRHGKESILAQFERRLANDAETERRTALAEILRIAALRLDQRITGADRLKVNGRLSTHVLDTHRGRPAHGVAVELAELAGAGEARVIAGGTTNADGRTDTPLIGGRPVPIARYELRFHLGAYYAGLGVSQADPPFLDVVPIRFAVAEPEGHYHVPLLATPWGYTTYRGS